jgi:hypothetical protein
MKSAFSFQPNNLSHQITITLAEPFMMELPSTLAIHFLAEYNAFILKLES